MTYEYATNGRLSVRANVPGTASDLAIELERESGLSAEGVARWKRVVTSDRGVSAELRSEELEDDCFDCDVLHVSGYALAAARRPPGARRVSVDLASWTVIEEAGPVWIRERLAALRPDVVFAGQRELEALGGEVPAGEVIRKWELPRPAAVAVDSTGAGDAFAAGFLVGGLELGLEAAARCVATVGALP